MHEANCRRKDGHEKSLFQDEKPEELGVSMKSLAVEDRGLSPTSVGCGRTTVFCGCMFSGKTSDLLARLSACSHSEVLVFKHDIDRRYAADAIVSHSGFSWPAISVAEPRQIPSMISPHTRVVAIEEAHFFDRELVDVSEQLKADGLDVWITTLDRDSWGRPFPLVVQLRALSDQEIFKTTTCARCNGVATRTQRLTPIVDGNLVGGPESYEPRCWVCWKPPRESPPAIEGTIESIST